METDPLVTVDRFGRMKLSDCRNRINSILIGMANGVHKQDKKMEDYIASSFNSESELSLLIRTLIKTRKSR